MNEQKMREALELADAALSGANMNMNVVMRKVKKALALQPAACKWKPHDEIQMPDTYQGACGVLWSLTEGSLEDNNINYCPMCGGRVHLTAAPEVKLSC